MQTLTVRNPVNMRSGYDTGAGILKKQVAKGSKFDVEQLVFPATGEIWAKLAGTFTNPAGMPSNAYMCVVQGNNVFCDLAGQPDPVPTGGKTYADGKADAIKAIQALP